MQRFTKILFSIFTFLILLTFTIYLGVWAASPMLIHHYANKALALYKVSLSENTTVRYNPFTSNISVNNLAFLKQDKTSLKIGKAELEVDLHKLLFDTIYIKTFSIEAADIDISVFDNKQEIAGIELPASEKSEEKQEQNNQKFPYTIEAPNLSLDEMRINIHFNDELYTLELKELDIDKNQITSDSQSLNISLKARAAQGDVNITSSINFSEKSGSISSKLSVKNIQLKQFQSQLASHLDSLDGKLSANFQSEIKISNNGTNISSSNTKLTLEDITTQKENYSANMNKYALELNNLELQIANDAVSNLMITGQTSVEGLSLRNTSNQDTLTSLQALTLSTISVSSPGLPTPENIVAAIDEIKLVDFLASHKNNEQQLPALAALKNMSVQQLSFSENKLSVEKVNISNLDSHILLGQDKSLTNLVDIPSQNEDQSQQKSNNSKAASEQVEQTTGKESNLGIVIGNIVMQGDNTVHFLDKSVQPEYERTLYIDEFNIGNIDSQRQDLSPFHFSGRSNKYAKIKLDGGIALFTDLVNANVKGDVNELSLPPLSSYVKQALGFELKSGQLDTNIDVDIKQSKLKGKVGLFIRGLDMSSAESKPDPSVLKEQTAIPLNVALGMLKDKKGNIKLNIPMSGSVDDPSFGLSSFLLLVTKKAAMSQAKSYLMQTFVPYASVVSVAISAGEFAMKLRFEKLPFSPTATDIEETQFKYMEQFISLMKDKPKTQVRVCGFATPEDINLPPGTKVTEEEELDRLRNIAKKRAENFKEYSVDVGNLESSRMLICNPQINFGKKAQPRVEIKI